MKTYWLFLFVLFLLPAAHGQEIDSVSLVEDITVSSEDSSSLKEEILYGIEQGDTVHQTVNPRALAGTKAYQSEKLPVRKFDAKKWKNIIGTTDYDETPDKPIESNLNIPKVSAPWGGTTLRIVVYVLIVAIIIYLLYYFAVNISPGTRVDKRTLQASDLLVPIDNIEDLDIQKWLQKTLADGNLRLAVRICYLGLLKKLNEHGSIVWRKNKTNQDYLNELLRKNEYVEEVTGLTHAYEQVWYGEHTLTRQSFDRLFADFERVQEKITMPPTP